MPPLRVGLDGRAFDSPAAGVRRYVAELTRALASLPDPPDLIALGGTPAAADAHGLPRVPEPLHPPTNLGWVAVGLPWAARRAGVALIHAPAYTAPLRAGVPIVLTIHDVSYARRPEWYPYRRDRIRRAYYARSARVASHVLTDSAFSADEIVAAYGIDRDRITVAPLGVDGRHFTPAPESVATEPDPSVGRTPYVLHVGDLHERRNLAVVVEALLELRRREGGSTPSLVLAGVERGAGNGLLAMAARAGAPGVVTRLGAVDDAQLLALYRSAVALVYPSRYEGFGLPVAEAMACGVPVVASRAASIPEVVGEAGILLDPDDVAGWTDAVARLARDGALRARLGAAGAARAATLTWARTAALTAAVYRRVAGEGRG